MQSEKKYKIIYADPPWAYRVWSKKGQGRSAEHYYQTQDSRYLQSLDIAAICDSDSVLLMWATFPCLPEALALGKSWGFVYKTVAFTWVKQNRVNNNLFFGMGYYTRSNAEVVLLFTRGKGLPRVARNVPQVLLSKIGPHSAKPTAIRERIVQLFGDLPRIELFARSRKGIFPDLEFAGWDIWGNEANGAVYLPLNASGGLST